MPSSGSGEARVEIAVVIGGAPLQGVATGGPKLTAPPRIMAAPAVMKALALRCDAARRRRLEGAVRAQTSGRRALNPGKAMSYLEAGKIASRCRTSPVFTMTPRRRCGHGDELELVLKPRSRRGYTEIPHAPKPSATRTLTFDERNQDLKGWRDGSNAGP